MNRTTPFDEMDRLFDQMRRSMLDGRPRADLGGANVRLETDDEAHVANADMPGFETDEIDLRFADGVLTIEGTHESGDESRSHSRHVRERVRVPGNVVVEDITAEYNNGVLEVRLPVEADSESGYRIDID
ncbi:Hsp20/alpha crystallin family protein [Natronomonas salina]|uniref:Hsp20/alpha crystallin family protein n=1 Tax=Natronomonas salina TaxID=1710540 RepID=UPI001FE54E12|nr:Hsp20/alpha crystallin family protein [Natronomonas salina]